MSKISWKVNGIYKQDPEEVAGEISGLGDKFSPSDVVDLARDESSVMHEMFEWDDEVAGEKYREIQAQNIIRLLVYEDDEKEDSEPVRIFFSTGERTKEYEPSRLIFQDEDKYQSLLQQAKADLEAFRRKYKTLVEFDALIELINELV